tara:strand:+ start:42 stop:296 length:255 start_codon:yes stop_codon:yes gene_type:complete
MRIIDLTEEVSDAKSFVMVLPNGFPEEYWGVHVDFKQHRLDYDLAIVDGDYYTMSKWGLGEAVSPTTNVLGKIVGYTLKEGVKV